MAGSVSGGEYGRQGAIAVDVVEIVIRAVEELPFQTRLIEILSDIAACRKPVRREGVFISRRWTIWVALGKRPMAPV